LAASVNTTHASAKVAEVARPPGQISGVPLKDAGTSAQSLAVESQHKTRPNYLYLGHLLVITSFC